MKNLRNMGKVAAAVAAAFAMTIATVAVAPANAADTGVCRVSTQASFEEALEKGTCSTIKISGDSNGVLGFGRETAVVNLGTLLGKHELSGYGEVVKETVSRDVTITTEGDTDVVMRNVQFDVQQGRSLTFDGHVVLDNAELAGINIAGLVALGSSGTPAGIDYGVKVEGNATFTMNGSSRMAVGAGNRTTQANRGIVLNGNGATVNLNSSGTYTQKGRAGLAAIDLSALGVIGGALGSLLSGVLGILSVDRDVDYSTVWGRDAAVYSEPGANTTINITNGSYSNQKDTEVTGTHVLNGAVSTSGTVNITGEGNAVKISSTKIGNAVDEKHNGVNTGGTLNIDNSDAVLDPGTELDSSARASTDSYAVELRGSAVMNLVGGTVTDTVNRDTIFTKGDPKVIETEAASKVNILASKQGDVKIATNREYYIEQVSKTDKNTFTARVNAAVSKLGPDPAGTDNYELWTSGANSADDALTQLKNLVASEVAGSDPAAAKLNASSYTEGRLSATYADATNQAIYGRKVIASGADKSPFNAVSGTGGTITLYGAPWTGTYKPGDTAPEQTGKLFAGWYTSQSAFNAEDNTQATSLNRDATGENPKHHTWQTGSTMWNNTLVLDKSNYEGGLYAHFVDEGTITLSAQTASSADGTRSVRFLSGVDSYNFKSSSFTVALVGGKTGTITSTTAYDYVTAADAKTAFAANPYYKKYSSDFTEKTAQGDARYLTTGVLTGLPANTAVTLTVTPKWTTLDGTTVSGSAYTVAVAADGSVIITKA